MHKTLFAPFFLLGYATVYTVYYSFFAINDSKLCILIGVTIFYFVCSIT